MLDIRPFSDFPSAAKAVLSFLFDSYGFDLWMVTRVEGNDWIVLEAEDHGYGVHEGSVFRWSDSFCSHMVNGEGPNIAPVAADVPVYANAPIGKIIPIGAYVGLPLTRGDGSLFGTLCAIDPNTKPQEIAHEKPLLELLARLLCTHLDRDLTATEAERRAEHAQADAWTDALTGLYNRRGWDHLLTSEEERCKRYGHPACILAVDLDGLKKINDTEGHGAGDELITRAATALRGTIREPHAAARVGGDEFVVLGVECDLAGADTLKKRVETALADANVEASVGLETRHPQFGLSRAWERADRAMYVNKRERRALLTK